MTKRFISSVLLFLIAANLSYSQEKYQKPVLEQKGSWSLIMVPDLQNYAKWGRNQPLMDLMTAWIVDNIDSLNIKMVMGVGDLVNNDEKITNDYDGDQTTLSQWQAVSKAFAKLDGKVPYIAATGNHDYSIDREGNRTSHYSEFFTIDRNHLNQKILVQNSRNEQGKPTLENAAYEIKGLNGKDYLFMTVENAPRDTVLTWAKKVAALEQYKNHRVILSTHEYLNTKDVHTNGEITWLYWQPYNINNQIQKSPRIKLPDATNGKGVWEKLVQPSSNIELVLCGHISGEGYRSDINKAGKPVHQVLFDAQSMGGGHLEGNGGDGWLRILEFFPDGKTVKVKTFSPLFGISPTTQKFAWKKDARNELTIKFD
ncbi:metallophosphoesterase [Flavisolibacter tropicus]|uniref:Serine/threonine protein phosphatase n=1 Tax=Flavisolibacter tropicus TaxID=1492898 RepID=A0A172U0D6_9BACT|nr:metallophosphoesterase [Flavisolibacter tropicus]ANE52648.1 serine/threonine protein phosphatase [Flavisolibacter tropicus]